jgi:hypothetical protein
LTSPPWSIARTAIPCIYCRQPFAVSIELAIRVAETVHGIEGMVDKRKT